MPRPLRINQPNLTYHVFSRCIECRDLLSDYFKDILLLILERAQNKYAFELINYTLLDNHFHFIIRTVPNGASISQIMQYIKARFAETYNKHKGRTGPFWNERFKDVIVEQQSNPTTYFFWLMWYIGFNPVRKGYVKSPENYQYSGIHCYLKEHFYLPVKITLHQCFLELGSTFAERVARFREWEAIYQTRHALLPD